MWVLIASVPDRCILFTFVRRWHICCGPLYYFLWLLASVLLSPFLCVGYFKFGEEVTSNLVAE